LSNPDLFKEIIPSILVNKKDPFLTEESYKAYVPYIVNKALSLHYDCIMQANQMNMNPSIPKDMQYKYLLNSIRGYKRKYQEWLKKEKPEDLSLIKEYFGVSFSKAKTMKNLLSSKEIEEIRRYLDKGGRRSEDE
jgi:hypothetical protein